MDGFLNNEIFRPFIPNALQTHLVLDQKTFAIKEPSVDVKANIPVLIL